MKIQQNYFKSAIVLAFILLANLYIFADTNVGRFDGWQTIGPLGGDIRAVTIDPRDSSRIYITTLDSQVYTSADAGKTWRFLTAFARPQVIVDDMMVDVENSNFLYVSGQRNMAAGGYMYSRDAGQTWVESPDLKDESVHCLAQSSKNPNIMLACAPGKVYLSYNRGETWKRVTDNNVGFIKNIADSAAFDPRDPNVIYVGTTHRAYKSIDGGKTWKLISKGMIDDSDVFAISIDPANPDHIIMSACSGIYETQDGGEVFAKINGIPSQSRRTRSIVVNPSKNGGIYAGTSEGFWKSADNGKTWGLKSQRELEINDIAVHPAEPNKIYLATNNYGLMVSTDGGENFSIQNGNFSSRFMGKIVPDVERPNRFYATSNNTATGGGFFYISDDGGKTWQHSTKNLSILKVQPLSILQDGQTPNTIYIGTNIGIYRSLDRGITWSPIGVATSTKPTATTKKTTKGKTTAKSTAVSNTVQKVAVLKMAVRNLAWTNDGKNGLLAATDSGLFRTYNVAQGWEKVQFPTGINQQISAVNTPKDKPSTIWVGTLRSGVLVSNDNGVSWKSILDIPSVAPVNIIETDPTDANRVYIGTMQTFFISKDGGATFIRRGGTLPYGNFSSILINPNNTNEIYVASSMDVKGGVYYSPDAGQSWRQIDTKDLVLPTRRIWTMAFDSKDTNKLLLGTHSSGIYRIEKMPESSASGTRPRVTTNQE